MASTSETGHPINVANFGDIISFCNSFGKKYNPSTPALQLSSLNTQYAQANQQMKDEKTLVQAFNKATNIRSNVFKVLKPLSTRIVNALESTDATAEVKKDARTIHRKIVGQRAPGGAKDAETPTVAADALPPDAKNISVSQQSFDSQVNNFDKLITLLQAEENYMPNETDLQVSTNVDYIALLRTNNKAVGDAYADYTNGLIARNKMLYAPKTGLVDTALNVKKYVLSIFTASSPEFKKVNSINFKNIK